MSISRPRPDQPSPPGRPAGDLSNRLFDEVFNDLFVGLQRTEPVQQPPVAPPVVPPVAPPGQQFVARPRDEEDAFLWAATDPSMAAFFGLGSFYQAFRDWMQGSNAPRVSAEMTPYIGENRLSLPLNQEVRIGVSENTVELFSRDTPHYTTQAMLRRTPEGWLVRAVGEGFHYRPEGATEFRHVPAGTSIRFGPQDEIRLGPQANALRLTFRQETPEQRSTQATAEQLGLRVLSDGAMRTVEAGAERARLIRFADWFQSADTHGPHESHVKVHVEISSAADLARVQAVLIPALMRDPELRRMVTLWKTIDPNFAIGNEVAGVGQRPTGQDQGAKGFTIYCATPEHALLIQRRISQILAENGLALPQRHTSGNLDLVDSLTNRVGISRDVWPATIDSARNHGFLLEPEIMRRVHEHFGLSMTERLSEAQHRQLETELGIAANRITYDEHGRLMMRASNLDSYHGGYYATEAGARTPGGLTDRPALYALYNRFNADPAEMLVQSRTAALEQSVALLRAPQTNPRLEAWRQQVIAALDNPETASRQQMLESMRRVLQERSRQGVPNRLMEAEILAISRVIEAYEHGDANQLVRLNEAMRGLVSSDPIAQSLQVQQQFVELSRQTGLPALSQPETLEAYLGHVVQYDRRLHEGAPEQRAETLTEMIRSFAQAQEGLGSDSIINRIQVVASTDIPAGQRGRPIFLRTISGVATAFVPVGRTASGDFIVEGRAQPIPAAEVTVRLPVSAELLRAATFATATQQGAWQGRQLQAELYHQLHEVLHLPNNPAAVAPAAVPRDLVMERTQEMSSRNVVTAYLQYLLQGERVSPSQPPREVRTSGVSLDGPIEIVRSGQLLRFSIGSDGRLNVEVRGPNARELSQEERDRFIDREALRVLDRMLQNEADPERRRQLENIRRMYDTAATRPSMRRSVMTHIGRAAGLGGSVACVLFIWQSMSQFFAGSRISGSGEFVPPALSGA